MAAVDATQHTWHEVVTLLIPRIAPDERARVACVSRAGRDAAANVALWGRVLELDRCTAPVTDAVVDALLARVRTVIWELRVQGDACRGVTGVGLLRALCAGVSYSLRRVVRPWTNSGSEARHALPAGGVPALFAACPLLELSDFAVAGDGDAESVMVSTLLPGPITLLLEGWLCGAAAIPHTVAALNILLPDAGAHPGG